MSQHHETNGFPLPLLGLVLVVAFWLFDATVDTYLFRESESFIEALFFCEPMELWMRVLVSILIVSFSLYADHLLVSQNEISQKLEQTNARLNEEILQGIETEKRLAFHANHDSLTGLLNRRKFDEILSYELERHRRYQDELTLVFCDIDYFKQINDNYGHEVGDKVLELFAEKLKSAVRETDVVARWGGEEFMLLLLNTTADKTERMADMVREKIECVEFDAVDKVTVSLGVTHFLAGDTKQALFKRADKALHLAKENGRNRVEIVVSS